MEASTGWLGEHDGAPRVACESARGSRESASNNYSATELYLSMKAFSLVANAKGAVVREEVFDDGKEMKQIQSSKPIRQVNEEIDLLKMDGMQNTVGQLWH